VYIEEGGPAVLLRFLGTSVHASHMEGALRHLHNLLVPRASASPILVEEDALEVVLGAAGSIPILLALLQASKPAWIDM
jgi:nitrate reductase gamma subunit